jgi:hypothetical protein
MAATQRGSLKLFGLGDPEMDIVHSLLECILLDLVIRISVRWEIDS